MESSTTQRNLWVLKDEKMTTRQHCAFTAEKVNDLQRGKAPTAGQQRNSFSCTQFWCDTSGVSGLTAMRQGATAAGAVKGHKNNKGSG